jgi:hypothetical protein
MKFSDASDENKNRVAGIKRLGLALYYQQKVVAF